MTDKERTLAVLAAVVVFLGGYFLGGQQRVTSFGQAFESLQASSHQHKHGTINVSANAAVPSVDLVVHQDAISGRNLEILTKNFRFAPEHASSKHVPGEGHAHLYIDGKKVARVYGHWFHIAEPASGTHSIRVTLNSNSHDDLVAGNKLIEDEEIITISTKTED